jgi:hypothetical protein
LKRLALDVDFGLLEAGKIRLVFVLWRAGIAYATALASERYEAQERRSQQREARDFAYHHVPVTHFTGVAEIDSQVACATEAYASRALLIPSTRKKAL